MRIFREDLSKRGIEFSALSGLRKAVVTGLLVAAGLNMLLMIGDVTGAGDAWWVILVTLIFVVGLQVIAERVKRLRS